MAQSPCKANINQQGTLEVAAGTSVLSRVPEFWKDQPRLWFTQLEAILAPQKQGDEYKYCTVIAKLSKEEILQVSDLITSPPTTDKYKNIKERLIDCYEETEQRQFQKLISETELGDQKPSQLLRQMRVLGRGKISDETIKLLWFRLLPTSVTTVLAVTEDYTTSFVSFIPNHNNIYCQEVWQIGAPKLTLCKEEDSVCLTKTANVIFKLTIQGVPELHIENLDPIYQEEILGDLTGLKYKLFNSTIEGSKNCDVVNMKLELQKSKLYLALTCPLLIMHGLYDVTGQILSIPIAGNGEFRVQCKDYYIQIDTDIKVSQRKDGKKYVSLKSYQINSELKGGMVSNLTNLFNGKQQELAESVLHFMNKHWRPVAKELQAPVFNINVKKLVLSFNKYLKSVPLEQILVDF